MNQAVSAYAGTVESLARKFVGWNGAEQDDLVQEGLIWVWQSIERGVTPSAEMIENRMKNWAKWLGRQTPIEYERMLPIDIPAEGYLDPDSSRNRSGGDAPAEYAQMRSTKFQYLAGRTTSLDDEA